MSRSFTYKNTAEHAVRTEGSSVLSRMQIPIACMTAKSKSAIRKISTEIGILTFLAGCLFQTLAEQE